MKYKTLLASWRQHLAEPGYSLVVILGLAVALAATYLIALLLNDRLLPDPAVPAPEQVVRVETKFNIPGRPDDWFDAAPYVLRDALVEAHGPVKHAARIFVQELSLSGGDRLSKTVVAFSDSDLVDVFGLRAEQGDVRAALQKPDDIVLTTRSAERLFGSKYSNPIGRHVAFLGINLVVAAIVPVQASNSEIQFDALMSINSLSAVLAGSGMGTSAEKSWTLINGRIVARLTSGIAGPQATDFMQEILDRSPVNTEVPPEWRVNGRKIALVRAVPLPRVHFDGVGSASDLMLYGALGVASLMMLGLAAVNYVNLSSVRTLRRQREIALLKSLGASPQRLSLQFILESVFVAVLAGAAGLLLAWSLASAFADFLNIQFTAKLFALTNLMALVSGCLLLGLLTGLYPAYVAMGVRCASALQGRKQSEGVGGRNLRRTLTVLQFTAAMTLSGAALVVVWQSEYISRLDMGFKTDSLVALDFPTAQFPGQAEGLYGALKSHPAVASLSVSDDVPGRSPIGPITMYDNGSIKAAVRLNQVDRSFFDVYQVPVLAGNLEGLTQPNQNAAGAEHPIALDVTAVQALGFVNAQDAIGKWLKSDPFTGRVVAVVGAIKQESARRPMQPQAFWLHNPARRVLTLKGENVTALREAVTEAWPRYFPDQVLELYNVHEQLAQRYRLDRIAGRLIAVTSFIAMLLAAFGVYALAAYTVRRAALEIVIRKLHGASHRHIAALLLKEFFPLLIVATLVSLPLIWWMSQQYLAGFVDRAAMGGWPLLAAFVGTVWISLLAGWQHGLAAMAMRPALALKD